MVPALPRVWATVMRTVRGLVLILAAASLGLASAQADVPPDPDSRTLQPQADPEGTVGELYADPDFFNVRNAVPPAMLQRLSGCFTPDLVRHFEANAEDVARWLEEHEGEDLKLPMSEGPIFLSNYEGADGFSVGRAEIDGTHATVPVSFSYTAGADTFRWTDVVMLRRVDGVWLMDDIRFDPERWDDYTLRQRVSLDE